MMRKLLLLAALSALAACPPREDVTPQIQVHPGAAQRIALFPSRSGRDAGPAATPARVHPLAKGDELGGPNAVGRAGDIVLENGEVVFVIDQLGSSSGFAESGGNVVDAADARTKKDELGMIFTYFGVFPRQGVYTRLTSGTSSDGAAWVEAKGRELYEPDLEVVTRYMLRPGDRALLLETTLTNRGETTVDKLGLGDAIQWGGAEKMAPGKPVGFKGPSTGPYVGGVGRHVSYAITSTEGEIVAISGGSWTDTEQKKDVALRSGQSVQYARVFVVGERADSSSLVGELIRASAGQLGRVEVQLTEGERAIDAFPGARVGLFAPGGGEVLGIVSAKEGSVVGGDVPPGTYEVAYASGGGRAMDGKAVTVAVEAGKTTRATIKVTRPGRLVLFCAELRIGDDGRQNRTRSACKVTIQGEGGTKTPDFGPAHASGPAKNQITTSDGAIDVPLAVGTYKVTVSRGPEYDTRSVIATVRPGETWTPASPDAVLLSRVVDTTGYLSTDFHQHTMLGADSPVALRDRVTGNAAEGLEIAVSSEHNSVVDLSGLVRELHLERDLVQIAGDEITTDSSKKPWGHANVFPLPFDASQPRGGAPQTRDKSAREVFADVRARGLTPAPVFQVNHPRTGITGYFDQLGFDPKTGVGTDPGYDPDFDALEVWNGRNVEAREKVLADYFALLRTKHPVTATADTDTHGIVGQEAGYPRTYVRVHDDSHLDAWSASRTTDLVRGVRERRDVVLTNGPFLRVVVNGAPIGGVARGREIEVKVHVESAPWIRVERFRVVSVRTGANVAEAPLAPKTAASGALSADAAPRVRVDADDALIVIAQGTVPMTPVLNGETREITPFAMTGAIWIDADGDGQSLGRRARTTP